MAERMREVVGAHSTWYVCDEHGWDFTNEGEDTCPVCKGESLAEERIIKLLDSYQGLTGMFALERDDLIALIKGDK